jgi:isoleucyl-tRNA synthetase
MSKSKGNTIAPDDVIARYGADTLTTGDTLSGDAWFEASATRQRPLDYLNASRDPFFALVRGDVTDYINSAHVRSAQPGD